MKDPVQADDLSRQRLAEFFVNRPVFSWVVAIVVMLAGALGLMSMPVSQYPDIAPPTIMISANYPGASAEVVENSVTQILEQELKGLDNLMYFSSRSSSSGAAEVMLTFRHGTDADIAQVQVQNKAAQASGRLPAPVQQQGLTVNKSQNNFLMILAFYDASDRLSDTDISDWLAGSLQDPLSRVDGVGSVQNFGSSYAMRIWLDPHKLNSYRLMPQDVIDAIAAQNTEVSVGELGALPARPGQPLNVSVTAMSRLTSTQQFRDILIKTDGDGAVVRLGDVARVELGAEDYGGTSKLNGHPASGLAIMLAPGANALQVAEAVKQRIAQLRSNFPSGVEVAFPEDTTRFVKLSIESVLLTLVEAVALVVLVMFVFLQNWRATLIPAITVPVVLLGTFGVLAVAGYSVNTLSLFAMVLAIGLLVDDAIVVVENVERIMREEGLDARAATLKSMGQITGVLIGVAAALAAVFLPMAFFSGSVGVIYRQFSVTLVAAMALSALAAICLTPALCVRFLRHGQVSAGVFSALNRSFGRVQHRYVGGLGFMLSRPLRFSAVYLLAVAVMALVYWRLPTAFIPDEDQGTVLVQFNLPAGATYDRTAKVAQEIERYFLEQEKSNVESVYILSGFSFDGAGQNAGMGFVALKDWSERKGAVNSAQAIADRATEAFGRLRDAQAYSMVLPPIEGLGRSNGFELWLQDLGGLGAEGLTEAAAKLERSLQDGERFSYVRAGADRNVQQLRVEIDREKASALGLALEDVNQTLSVAWGGYYVNDFVHQGRVKKVLVQADAPYRASPDDLRHWFVRGAGGAMTPFTAFSGTEWRNGPTEISRYNGLHAIPIFGAAAQGVSSGDAMAQVEAQAARLSGANFEWSGLSYQDKLASGQAPLLYLASILFVFLCLAALYESWTIPCAVAPVIPLGVLGALLAVYWRGLPNDIYFQVGLLTTIGLSAKNAILIVEFAEAAVRQGMTPMTAVVEGARLRLRPILMTSLAFGAGVTPLALSTGPGSASQNAIGTSVMGGVLTATTLAIFFVPLFYLWVKGPILKTRRRAVVIDAPIEEKAEALA
ncbi:efflux RND transporter permease subunit [Hahella sp. NBU794]|uniref:efflux RND transporter permease subunit n=1 Tax=Hahella sp. NBU794 TaxID=3422590 RepID=UPI003D701039